MKAIHSEHICQLLHTLVEQAGVAPGAVAAVAYRDDNRWCQHIGYAGRCDHYGPQLVAYDTIYDLASLTKPIVAFAFARAVDRGILSFQDSISRWLPFCVGSPIENVSLLSLLSHRSGLPAHVELFGALRAGTHFDPISAWQRVVHCERSIPNPNEDPPAPGKPDALGPAAAVYSDLGYLLAGEALQRATGCALDAWVCEQLDAAGVREIWSARQLRAQAIPTERVAPTELLAYRGGLVRAQVHDENAWALNGLACSGHAGLFGTASGVLAFGKLMLDIYSHRSRALSQHCSQLLLSKRSDSTWRVGFDGKSATNSSAGAVMTNLAFGHLGFTGTSFWCDPKHELGVVLLTNRVCPSRDNTAIRRARPLLNDELAVLGIRSVSDLGHGPQL